MLKNWRVCLLLESKNKGYPTKGNIMEVLGLVIAAASIYVVWKNILSTPIHKT